MGLGCRKAASRLVATTRMGRENSRYPTLSQAVNATRVPEKSKLLPVEKRFRGFERKDNSAFRCELRG